MKKYAWATLLVSIAFVSCDKENDNNKSSDINSTDKDFVLNASMANTAEINAGSTCGNTGNR